MKDLEPVNDDETTSDEAKENAPGKRGPKPKELTEGSILGLPIGRGDNKAIVPPEQVYELAGLGCTDREIAGFYGVKEDTLRRNFADELSKGREHVKIKLRRAMMHNACVNMNAAVQIWLSKQMLNMTDNGPSDSDENAPLPWSDDE